ncbi:MAG TPA: type I methionyl aminopeptidase [Nitrospiraceae bacterium]|jgi:methionyl aminopeptidase|nr:type I methionyl aminopeptidase [Nitrospiraceae bacterium]
MIIIKSPEEIERMAAACRIVAETLRALSDMAKPGISTRDIEGIAEKMILKKGGALAFKGYRGFPAGICTSINDQVVHGIPSSVILREGDIISIDLGVYMNGFYGDGAITLPVGKISKEAERLLQVTENALYLGIEKVSPGNRVSDVSHAIQKYVEANGYSVVRALVGHGIGRSLHEAPQVPNYGGPGQGPRLREGMTFAIEPMVNAGSYGITVLDDGWTAVTLDHSLSAHFEHTVAVTENGVRILTKID